MPERVVRHFQEELEQLKNRLLEMGGLAEERVRTAVDGLVSRDLTLVQQVLQGDGPINQLHIEIDNRCFTLLALHQPMAVDLRAIVAAVKINVDLERVGDLAVNIAEAKAKLSALVDRAAAGEEIILSRAGRPVARLVPFTEQRQVRKPGVWRGQVKINDDFDTFSDDEAREWYGH